MTTQSTNQTGFSLLELLLAMAIFSIVAVSLSQAINQISLSVIDSVESSERREILRGVLIEESRKPNLREGIRETAQRDNGLYFRIQISKFNAENRESILLENLYEVTVTALLQDPAVGVTELESLTALSNPALYQ